MHQECDNWQCKECNPPPPVHPEYGNPVYDPYFKCWTYPYATRKIEYSPRKMEKPPSPPDTHDIGTLADYVPEDEKPETKDGGTNPVMEIQTQTTADVGVGGGRIDQEIAIQVVPPPRPMRYTREEAIRILVRVFRRLLYWRRLAHFR